MIWYRKQWGGLGVLFQMTGSVLPRAMFQAVIFSSFAAFLKDFISHDTLEAMLEHPYPFQVFAFIFSFTLVFRNNAAYGRYMEARGAVTVMSAKWGDAVALALSFDEHAKEGAAESKEQFQATLLHRFSLMHALALQYLRRDNDLCNLVAADSGEGTEGWEDAVGSKQVEASGRGASCAQICSSADHTEQRHIEEMAGMPLPVLGGIGDVAPTLEHYDDRVAWALASNLSLVNTRRAIGGLVADPPAYSRVHQAITDGMQGFQQARKIEETPFPFPYAQLLTFMLYVFAIAYPVLAAAETGGPNAFETGTYWVPPFLTFLVTLTYFGMHEVATVLEDPFVNPPNDLPTVQLQEEFNERLVASWDGCEAVFKADDRKAMQLPQSPLLDQLVKQHRRRRQDRSAASLARQQAGKRGIRRQSTSPNKFWEMSKRPPLAQAARSSTHLSGAHAYTQMSA